MRTVQLSRAICEIKTLSEYQNDLERFENFNDGHVLPGIRLIVRVDARRSAHFSEKFSHEEYPYSDRVHQALLDSAVSLMQLGIQVDLGFVHGDEISLLLSEAESITPRRRHKLVSLVSSGATLDAMLKHQLPLLFHAKLSEIPSLEKVFDYFLWQRRCATRNFPGMLIRRKLESQGLSAKDIDSRLGKLSLEERKVLAAELQIDLAAFPHWKNRGALVYRNCEKGGSGEERIEINLELPEDDAAYLHLLDQYICKVSEAPKGSSPQAHSNNKGKKFIAQKRDNSGLSRSGRSNSFNVASGSSDSKTKKST